MTELLVICRLTPAMSERLETAFVLHHARYLADRAAWLAEHGSRISYVLTDGHLGIDAETMAALPNLRAVSSYGVGYDAVDIVGAVARGIPVSHTPSVLDEEVATTALMLMIACYRNFLTQAEHARSGAWAREGSLPLARSADNRTVGILGLGRIGKTIAGKLAPFNARILYSGRTRQDVDFEFFPDLTEMARASDVLISIVPGGAATRHLISTEVMEALGPEGILINVGRGSTVDETALITALQSGRLGGAGLDVFEAEPEIPKALCEMPNVVLTPHIGSATVETRAAMGDLAVENLLRHHELGTLVSPVPESRRMLAERT